MRVSSCCCCFSLKTGCIIIAVCSLILSLMLLVSSLTDRCNPQNATEGNEGQAKNSIIEGILWTSMAIKILYAFVSLLLVLGAMKELRVILLIWVIVDVVFLVVVVSEMSVCLVSDTRNFMALIGKRIFGIIIELYFLVVVKSFYSDLKDKPNNNAQSV